MIQIYALGLLLTTCVCFNVDVDNVVHIKGTDKSQFGYSALMFINDANEKWVVVGATKANFTSHSKYKTPGNVYKCRLNLTLQMENDCTAMNLEQTGVFRWGNIPGYEADDELQGASMAMIDDTIVTCAPLWKNMIPCRYLCRDPNNCNSTCIVHPLGRCFNVKNTLDSYTTYTFKKNPLVQDTGAPADASQFWYEFAQIGLSISQKKFNFPSEPVLLGAPGLYENTGGFLLYDQQNVLGVDRFYHAFSSNAYTPTTAFHFGDLLGYSVTTGIAVSASNCASVTVYGAPHFTTLNGIDGSVFVVCAMTTPSLSVEVLKQFFGRKSGGGFGTSIVFQDVNNDGLDDLLVGEPLYFDVKTNIIDMGAVYIYYGHNDSTVILELSGQILHGSDKDNGRFGTSMEFIGDINKDNYNDIAISAPYEDDLRGAIYIYHGGPSALTLAQRITPTDIGTDIQSFGWYISAAYDIDNNQYPDFAVGSYMSDTVSIFRTRPIIILNSVVDTIPNIIPLNSSGQLCEDQYFRPCVTLQLCFDYNGEFVPEKIRIYYSISADIQRTRAIPSRDSRVGMNGNELNNQTFVDGFIDVTKENGSCVRRNAVVQTINREFYATLDEVLVFETSFELSNISINEDVEPILQSNTQTVKQATANFSTGCNDTCHPDLHINTRIDNDEVFLGEATEIVLKIHISNTGDQSYGTQLLIDYSNNTKYIGFSQPQDENTELIVCEETLGVDNDTCVECNMDTTFYKGQNVAIIARFAISRSLLINDNQTFENFNQDIQLKMSVHSTTPDDDGDNMDTVNVKVKLMSSVELSGISNPDELQLSDWGSKGIVFTHSYNIFNHGPSPLSDYSFYICLPVMGEDGTRLIAKENLKVIKTSTNMTWRILHYPEEPEEVSSTTENIDWSTITTPIGADINSTDEMTETTTDALNVETFPSTSIPDRTSSNDNEQHKMSTTKKSEIQKIVETRGKLKFNVLTCQGKHEDAIAILEFSVSVLEKTKGILFELPFNLSENALDFEEVSGVIYRTRGVLPSRNGERYVTTSYNTTYEAVYVSTDIYGKEIVAVVTKKISIWIIVGASVGGFVLLIILGVILKKCGFFERKKREDVKKWKRQSGYYADRQSRVSMVSAKAKSVNWETLNNEFSSFGKVDKKEKKLVTIKE